MLIKLKTLNFWWQKMAKMHFLTNEQKSESQKSQNGCGKTLYDKLTAVKAIATLLKNLVFK